MSEPESYSLDIQVETGYLAEHSSPDQQQYTFFYTITLCNCSSQPLRLLRRHWLITDGNGKVNEVSGEGVVGKQPLLKQNQPFTYTSSAIINTEVGAMQGHYILIDPEGNEVEAEIPAFNLSLPNKLH